MKKYLNDLQNRTHAQKSSFAFAASLVLTGIVAAAWLLSVAASPQSYFGLDDGDVEQDLANAGSLFDSLKANFQDLK